MGKEQVRERIRNLQERMTRKGNLSKQEKKELNKLREDEQNIDRQMVKITGLLESDRIFSKIFTFLSPFRVIIGISLLCLSLLIFASLFITSLDRLLHSKCGFNCGYLLDDMNYTNYLDFVLLYSSRYFHLDYLMFTIINLYVYFCSIFGFVRLGIKIFLFTVNKINKFRCLT